MRECWPWNLQDYMELETEEPESVSMCHQCLPFRRHFRYLWKCVYEVHSRGGVEGVTPPLS